MAPVAELDVLLRQMRSYQRAGVVWALARLREAGIRAVGLVDEPGLGKTLQALGVLLALNAQRVVVTAPAGARRVWAQEIRRWLPQWADHVLIVEPGVRLRDCLAVLDRSPLILLVAYDSLSETSTPRLLSWARAIEQRRWDALVIDEGHFLKNPSNRTHAVYGRRGSCEGIHAACERVLLLTGTLTPNHAGEVYNHMRALWPKTLLVPGKFPLRGPPGTRTSPEPLPHTLTHSEFEERVTEFRDTTYGRQIVRSKNQTWLRERLGPVLLRRTKAQVLPELPSLVTQDVPLARPTGASLKAVPASLWRQSVLFWDRTRRQSDDQFLSQLADPANNLITLRRELGLLKADPAAEWVTERLSCGIAKMLVFGWHVAVLERLHDLLREYNPVLVTGSTPPNARSRAQEAFQRDPRVRVFVGQILAAGTAITLTAASEVVIVEPSWVPGENTQAIDRAHRLGQRDSVLASFLYLPNTLDQRIMSVFRRKAAEIAPLLETSAENDVKQGSQHYASAR